MTMMDHRTSAAPELASASPLDELLLAARAEAEEAELVEHRCAALNALLRRYGARYLPRCTAELDAAIARLAEAGEFRARRVAVVAAVLGLSGHPTLGELAESAPEPYGSALAALRVELLAHRRRIGELSDSNTAVLGERMLLVREALADSGSGSSSAVTYERPGPGPGGRRPQGAPRLVRGVL